LAQQHPNLIQRRNHHLALSTEPMYR